MRAMRLDKGEVPKFLAALKGKGYSIWAPTKVGEAVEFCPLQDGEAPDLGQGNARLSPKALAFPQSEEMFRFSMDRSRQDAFMLKEVSGQSGDRLLFGVRPCDARAFALLDKVFLVQGAQEDTFYLRNREKMVLVGLGCRMPCATCFCHSTGGGPFSTDGLDIIMTDLGGAYLVRPVSEKGEALVADAGLSAAGQDEVERAEQLAKEALASMGETADPRGIRKRPLMELFADPYWETAHETCIKCGTCTYLCPTCSCFDIQDETHGGCGTRGRNWDSCMFSLTTLHASGHNPRPTGKERFRQRFMHKLKYFQDDFDTVMCVGCGRCIQYCPVNIDIRETIAALSA